MEFSKIKLEEFAFFIYEALRKEGINAVLVGGACVSIRKVKTFHPAPRLMIYWIKNLS